MNPSGNSRDIISLVAARAERYPNKPFLILETARGTHILSYGDLVAQAGHYAGYFRQVPKGATIVFMLVTHPAFAPAFLGAIMAGVVPTLFPPLSPRQDAGIFWPAHKAVFERLDVALLLTDAGQSELALKHLPQLKGRIVEIEAWAAAPGGNNGPFARRAPSDIAFLQHSSGTTGAKKGVMLSHASVADFVDALGTALAVRDTDVIISWLPLYHDMGLVGCFVLPMLLGLTVVQLDPFEWVARPESLLECIERRRGTICWMPNFAFHHILRSAPATGAWDLSSLRALIDCSEPCKPETLRRFRNRFSACGLGDHALQASYGMAENVFIATQTDVTRSPRTVVADLQAYSTGGRIVPPQASAASIEFLSVGPPIPHTKLRIMDLNQKILAERQVGEIAVSSTYLFDGYFRLPMPEGKLKDGWYRTGDLGFIDGGEVFVSGRVDDLLIVHGKNIYAHDVEFSINQNIGVKPGRVVAIAPYDARAGSRSLVIIAEVEKPGESSRLALRREIGRLIDAEFGTKASDIVIADPGWLIKTTSGKISRSANEKRYLEQRSFAELGGSES
jgi:acyl-CoA synthetase (AMP-forming)/AMP-acid ligase II